MQTIFELIWKGTKCSDWGTLIEQSIINKSDHSVNSFYSDVNVQISEGQWPPVKLLKQISHEILKSILCNTFTVGVSKSVADSLSYYGDPATKSFVTVCHGLIFWLFECTLHRCLEGKWLEAIHWSKWWKIIDKWWNHTLTIVPCIVSG